jgi:hypothetical protein
LLRSCGEFEVPAAIAASSFRNFKFARTRIHIVASAPLFPKFALSAPQRVASFGNGALVGLIPIEGFYEQEAGVAGHAIERVNPNNPSAFPA